MPEAEREAFTETFRGCYWGRRVLVTGHTGFKGSWLVLWLQSLGAEVSGLALEPDTDPSHWNLLGSTLKHDLRLDIRDADGVHDAVERSNPEIVFHLAAQPLVRRGYRDPGTTFATNVMGSVNVLEALRVTPSIAAIVIVTTDKVYEPRRDKGAFSESDELGGHDPYSASKTCVELLSASYRRSYFAKAGVPLATARAGNVIGGGDWAEDRLVPDLVRATVANDALRVRNPAATRPWQHVLEPLSGYLRLGQALLGQEVDGGAWNFGPSPDATLTVADVVERLRRAWPALEVRHDSGPHPHETADLALDCGKAERGLGWRPVWSVDATLSHTAEWYRAFTVDGRMRSTEDLRAYVTDANHAGLGWAGTTR